MNALEAAIYAALAAGTALTTTLGGTAIYNVLAPRDKSLPYVVFSQQSGREDDETPRRTQTYRYLVKGVAHSLVAAGTIADQVDGLLRNNALTVSGWTTYWAHPETTVRYIEPTDAGEHIGHAGAVYTFRLSE